MNLNIKIPNLLNFSTHIFNININLTEYSKITETKCLLCDILIPFHPPSTYSYPFNCLNFVSTCFNPTT